MNRIAGGRHAVSVVAFVIFGLLATLFSAPTASAAGSSTTTSTSTASASAADNAKLASATSLTKSLTNPATAPGPGTPPPKITPVAAMNPGSNSTVSVPSGPSKALTSISPLAAVDPAAGSVTVPSKTFTPQPKVTPSPIVLPTRPGQTIVDDVTADATTTLRNAGRLNADGTPNLDANQLQPQVPSAKFIDPAQPATLQDLIKALTSGNLPPNLPVDPLALLNALPDGIPRITYRVCSESDTKAASCSLTLPLAVPALVNVTGTGHLPQVLVDMVPIVAPGDIIAAVQKLLNVQSEITDAQNELNVILQLLTNPLEVILHPELLVEKLDLQKLLADLAGTLKQDLQALLDLIDVGVALLEIRLPTAGTGDLHAHVWGVYDLPTHKRLSVGFDGYRRGDSLPTAALGVYTLSLVSLLQGTYDINARVLTVGAGKSLAITAGLGTVSSDANGDVIDPTVASAQFSPVPLLFSAHAVIDPGSSTAPETASISAFSTTSTHLDAQVLSDGPTSSSFTQAKIDSLPNTVSATVTRPQQGPDATVAYSASSAIGNVLFANDQYSGSRLDRSTQVTAADVPSSFNAALAAATTSAAASDHITFDYTAGGSLASLNGDYFDRSAGIVGQAGLTKLPTNVSLLMDRPTSHVSFTANQALGSATVNVSRNLGAYAPISGDHATLVTSGTGVGISAQVSGLKSVDAYYDGHPRLATQFDPGGQAFEAAGNLDGDQKAQLNVTNLPATLSIDADTAAHKISYAASTVVHRVQVEYTKVSGGPTLFAAVDELPQSVNVTYALGDKPEVTYQASSSVPRVELFAGLGHLESLSPDTDHYVSALLTDLPTKVDYALDIPNHHLEGTSDTAFGGIDVVARLPIQGRDWTADGSLTGVPAHFDADFGGGTFRFRGLSGPLTAASFTVTDHNDPVEPTGLHVAAHYRQSTGDIDGSLSVGKLTTVGYTQDGANQTFTLQADTGGAPVFVDANVLLGADDTQLAVTGKVSNLPTTLNVSFGSGKLTYTADKHIGIELEAHVGKVAAISQTSAPLFNNGVSLMAAGCSGGAGCASDKSAFCTVFAPHCLGLTSIINLPGLPTSVVVDTQTRTVAVTDYAPPSSKLQAYVRLSGLISSLPDIRALATLSGLPSPVNFTVGPMNFSGSTVDATYNASSPLGSLELDGQATTTNTQFSELRGRVTVGTLPASMHITGQFGQQTIVHVNDSAAVGSIGVTITSPTTGYLQGSVDGVPATADVTADLAKQHIAATMSSPISGVHLLAHVPYQGRTWSAYLNVLGIPGAFNVDYAGGSFSFDALSGPLRQAAAAITNNPNATAPTGPHLAVHFRQSTNDMDASAQINDLTSVAYTHSANSFTVKASVASQTIALDGNVILASSSGADDVRLGALGTLGPIPSSFTVGSANGAITYSADQPLSLTAQLWLGKIAALNGIGVHEFDNGISAADGGCAVGGAGCANAGQFVVNGKGFGAVAIVNVNGLPKQVVIDPVHNQYGFSGYQPRVDQLDLYLADSVFIPKPLSGARLWATLTNLPSSIDFTLGPLTTGASTHIGWSSNVVAAGDLTVRAEADGVPLLGTARALAVLDPIPGSLSIDGTFAANSEVKVSDSTPINDLSLTATATFQNSPASGMVALTGIPKSMDFKVGDTQSGNGQKFPSVAYSSDDSTLNGTFHVEAALALKFETAAVGIDDAYLKFLKLGKSFVVSYKPSSQSAQISSTPATQQVQLGVSVFVGGPIIYNFDGGKHLFDVAWHGINLLYGTMGGHADINPKPNQTSHIGMLVTLNDISSVTIKPGQQNSGLPLGITLPAFFGYLYLAFIGAPGSGGYSTIDVQNYDVSLNLDVNATFRLHRTFSPVDLFSATLTLGPADSLEFHRYTTTASSVETFNVSIAGIVPLGCLSLTTKPGGAETARDGIGLSSSDGPQMISFLDPGGQVSSWILDLFAYANTSIGGMSFDWNFLPTSCPS